jgi:glyoxylase-like metal-dependent hydrolase (beta-lactamase superfamily II)
MKLNHKFSIFIITILLAFQIQAQVKSGQYDDMEGGGDPDPYLSQNDNNYLDRQAKVFLDTVQSIIKEFPPQINEARERGLAKLLMDAVFHEHYTAYRKPAQQFFHSQVAGVIKELESTKVERGAKIWKVYNMGFIVRTKSVTMAFDLVAGRTAGASDFALDQNEIDRLVAQCDVLFLSHWHPDHADRKVAEKFISLKRPVIAPEQVWEGEAIHSEVLHMERIAHKVQKLKLKDQELDVIVYPGHQMKRHINNVVLVKTKEGINIAHTGDQINEGDFMVDFEWIDEVAKHHDVDIMMPNAWTTDILRQVKAFDPKVVLPGHELELGHTVWDRLPYWGDDAYLGLNYEELKKSNYPVIALIWGESYHYYKENK